MNEVHELLVRARERLANGHHLKGRLADDAGGYCAIGAVDVDTVSRGAMCHALDVLRSAVGLPDVPAIADWNNAPERTKAEVVAAFDKAIAATAPTPDMSWLHEPAPERATA